MPSSGYTAITFVANEQPTTAKWNLIGSNFESLVDGSGFDDRFLSARHVGTHEDYGTSEVDTGRKWIDGKTIYSKTIDYGALPNSSSKSVSHGISTIDTVAAAVGVADNTQGTRLVLPYSSAEPYQVSLVVNNTNISTSVGTDRTGYTKTYVTILYTKV